MFRKTGTIVLALVLVLAFANAFGQDAKKEEMKETVKKGKPVTMEGTLVCMGCALKAEEGANSACSVYGHIHSLKTADGKFINFLPNQYSADLIKGGNYDKKTVTIDGVYHSSANQLDVSNFSVDGNTMSWCKEHKAMDGCMAAKSGK